MRLASILRDASDLDGSVRSLPIHCKNAQASSNASQTVRVLLKLNITQSPHADMLRCESRRTLKRSCDEVDWRPGRFATAARSLRGYARHCRRSIMGRVAVMGAGS